MSGGKRWTRDEDELVRKGVLPEGRAKTAAYMRAWKLGVGFRPVRDTRRKNFTDSVKNAILADYLENGLTSREIGRKYGCSRMYVVDLCGRLNLKCPRLNSRLKLGKFIEYGGRKYVWNCGVLRSTDRDRENLARRIYEDRIGPVPEGHMVIHKDGDPCNFVAGNLEAISYEEFGRRTAKNPDRADFNRAVLAMGRLINYSKEMQHDAR